MKPIKIKMPLIFIFAAFFLSGTRLHAQFTYQESFKNSTADGWVLAAGSGSTAPTLTAATGVDTAGNGWLRLTTNTTNQSDWAYLNNPIPSSSGNNITLNFTWATWNGTGADGFAVAFFDASSTFSPGAFGGSLGYAQRTTPGTVNGMNGAYVGVGFDDFGNFSNPTEGRNGGVGFSPNAIAVRGSGNGTTGYNYLGGTADATSTPLSSQMDFPTYTTRPVQTGADFRSAEVTLTADGRIIVSYQSGATGTMTQVLDLNVPGTRPDNLILAFTASTGSSTEIHELRSVTITTTAQPVGTIRWDNDAGTSVWDNGSAPNGKNWENDALPITSADILFDNKYVSTAQSIDVQSNRTVRSISFDAPFNYTLNNSTLTFDVGSRGGTPSINVSHVNGTSSPTINSAIVSNQALTIDNESTGTLTLNGTLNNNGNTTTVKGTGTTTITNVISGAGGLTMDDSSKSVALNLTAANTYTGATLADTGTLTLSGASGALTGTSGVTIDCQAIVKLDNSGTNNTNRIKDTASMTLMGGELWMIGNASANSTETIGAMSLSQEDSIVTLDAGTGKALTLTAASFARSAGTTVLFRGDSLGTAATGTANVANMIFTTTPTLTGGAGALASNTTSIIVGAVGDTSLTGEGTDFVTYTTNGVQLLTTHRTVIDSATATENVKVTANSAITASRSMESLLISGTNTTITGPGNRDITVNSGMILATGSGDSIDSTIRNLKFGTAEGIITVSGSSSSLNIGASVQGSGGLSKSGSGTLTFSGTTANTYTGNTWVNNGTLTLSKSAGTDAIASGTVFVECGGTLLLGANNQINDTVNMTLRGGTFATGGNSDTLGTLTLSENSTIDMSGGNSIINFADSSGTTWDANSTLTITNWDPLHDQLFFGNSSTGLTQTQINQIEFVSGGSSYGAYITSTGEIRAHIPEASTVIAIFFLTFAVVYRERNHAARLLHWLRRTRVNATI